MSPIDPPTSPRFGITVPFDGATLMEHRGWFAELADLGYTDVWTAEVDGSDGFTPLALAAAWEPELHLGVAIAPVYTRGPALLAQTAAAMAEAAPGRFVLGIGTSSEPIVSRWNGIPFADPYGHARDTLRFLRAAFSGEKVDMSAPTVEVHGFRMSRPPRTRPPVYLAALRQGMLRLAGAEADGVILNWLSAEDVSTVLSHVGTRDPEFGVVARLFVVPSPDAEVARAVGRRMIAGYLNVETYAAFHRWLGRGSALEPMWEAWAAGDRRRALEVIPDEVVDALIIHGRPEACREHVQRYVEHGITVPVLAVVPAGIPLRDAVRSLAPTS